MKLQVATIEEVQQAVRQESSLLPRGGGSKSALSAPPDSVTTLDLSRLSGILSYDPHEFTFTALAGTPVAEVKSTLAEYGQYLPFDPILVERGATLGGTVAANGSGPGRYRFGGVRDFLLEIHFVDGTGEVVRGGGKVVKNVAGFDLPKLMVGSMGRLGVLVELTFKVFPVPAKYLTLCIETEGITETLETLFRLATAPFDLEAVDIDPPNILWIRLGGLEATLAARADQLNKYIGRGKRYHGQEEAALWRDVREFAWLPDDAKLVKVPITPRQIPLIEEWFSSRALRRFSVGGNVAWIAWREEVATLENLLRNLRLQGIVLLGSTEYTLLGERQGGAFAQRVKEALDRKNIFLEV